MGLEPPAPWSKPSALPNCATPRSINLNFLFLAGVEGLEPPACTVLETDALPTELHP